MNATLLRLGIGIFLLSTLSAAGCDQSVSEVQTVGDSKTITDQTALPLEEPQQDESSQAEAGTPVVAKPAMAGMAGMGKMKFPAPKDMKFKDTVESNIEKPKSISELVFSTKDGNQIKLADFIGQKNIILVFTEGFNGMLCPFCKTQTSRLVVNYEKFEQRDCEVIVVYPGAEDHLDEFIEAALKTEKEQVDQVPFPIVLDKDFAATDYFDIHSKHAHPSTYLIDKQGNVKFAYVGADMTADRPSIKAMLAKLDQLQE